MFPGTRQHWYHILKLIFVPLVANVFFHPAECRKKGAYAYGGGHPTENLVLTITMPLFACDSSELYGGGDIFTEFQMSWPVNPQISASHCSRDFSELDLFVNNHTFFA